MRLTGHQLAESDPSIRPTNQDRRDYASCTPIGVETFVPGLLSNSLAQLCTLASEKSVIGIICSCYHLRHVPTSTCKTESLGWSVA